ncbi:hypothetical protein WJX81_006866 [Elliptochloris bilobata]|uniref:Uncharacterized protein n=1 Tax=Elliptochloris bilobata TaxID=381761 RepID=A0AAW1SJU6_9CHLO
MAKKVKTGPAPKEKKRMKAAAQSAKQKEANKLVAEERAVTEGPKEAYGCGMEADKPVFRMVASSTLATTSPRIGSSSQGSPVSDAPPVLGSPVVVKKEDDTSAHAADTKIGGMLSVTSSNMDAEAADANCGDVPRAAVTDTDAEAANTKIGNQPRAADAEMVADANAPGSLAAVVPKCNAGSDAADAATSGADAASSVLKMAADVAEATLPSGANADGAPSTLGDGDDELPMCAAVLAAPTMLDIDDEQRPSGNNELTMCAAVVAAPIMLDIDDEQRPSGNDELPVGAAVLAAPTMLGIDNEQQPFGAAPKPARSYWGLGCTVGGPLHLLAALKLAVPMPLQPVLGGAIDAALLTRTALHLGCAVAGLPFETYQVAMGRWFARGRST